VTAGGPHRAARVALLPNGEVGIVWEDGHESYFPGRYLRCACACAECVDEMSGRKLLQDERVPEELQALELHSVGNYAISVRFSDGHDTGIYAYERLRRICPCCR
jgi:DUF971 family protein